MSDRAEVARTLGVSEAAVPALERLILTLALVILLIATYLTTM